MTRRGPKLASFEIAALFTRLYGEWKSKAILKLDDFLVPTGRSYIVLALSLKVRKITKIRLLALLCEKKGFIAPVLYSLPKNGAEIYQYNNDPNRYFLRFKKPKWAGFEGIKLTNCGTEIHVAQKTAVNYISLWVSTNHRLAQIKSFENHYIFIKLTQNSKPLHIKYSLNIPIYWLKN